jgi:hypothetical protein
MNKINRTRQIVLNKLGITRTRQIVRDKMCKINRTRQIVRDKMGISRARQTVRVKMCTINRTRQIIRNKMGYDKVYTTECLPLATWIYTICFRVETGLMQAIAWSLSGKVRTIATNNRYLVKTHWSNFCSEHNTL